MNLHAYVDAVRKEWWLWAIVAGAFLLRVVGIGYGLPLMVVYDEPPFTLGALLMLQLHTLIPALHASTFATVLYYPVYTSYFFLIPFAAIIGIKYLFFHGSLAVFQAQLISDLTPFFIVARLFSVALGTWSVYLIYRIAERLFISRVAAIGASFLLATSLLHVALSMVNRHWIEASFVYILVLYVLTRNDLSLKRRYLFAFLVTGIGMGFTSICAVVLVMAGLYYLCFDVRSVRQVLSDVSAMLLNALLFVALAVVPYLLWYGGKNFTGALSFGEGKSIADLVASPWDALSLIWPSEPVLVALFLGGLAFAFFQLRRHAAFLSAWFLAYIVVFYLMFRIEARFLLPIFPLLALAGGYCVHALWQARLKSVVLVLLLVPLVCSLWFALLAAYGDTHQLARQWVLTHMSPQDKVMIFSFALHIPTTKVAVEELRGVDPKALFKVDEADATLDRSDVPYVFNNLTSVRNKSFIASLPQYAEDHGYSYIVVEPRSFPGIPDMAGAIRRATVGADIVKEFKGVGDQMSISDSNFLRPFWELFNGGLLGPDILIYHLRS